MFLVQLIVDVVLVPVGRKVVLLDGYGAAEFAAEWAALPALRDVMWDAEVDLRCARTEVLMFQEAMVAVVMAYGHSARGRLAARSPLLESLPRTWLERHEAGAVKPRKLRGGEG